MEGWQKLLLAAGGAAAVGAALYYLLREDAEAEAALLKANPGLTMSKADVMDLLKDMVNCKKDTQNKCDVASKEIADKLKESDGKTVPFEEVYSKVQGQGVSEVLDKRGLTSKDLDAGISAHQADPEVMMLLQQMMSPASEGPGATPGSPNLSTDRLLEVYKVMVEASDDIVSAVDKLDKANYDGESVLMATQVYMDAMVCYKCNVEKSAVEASTMKHQMELMQKADFMQTQQRISMNMEKLFRKFNPNPMM